MLDPTRNPYPVSWLHWELTLLGQQCSGHNTLGSCHMQKAFMALIMVLLSCRVLWYLLLPRKQNKHYSPTNLSVLLELHPGYTVPGFSMKQCDQQMTMFKWYLVTQLLSQTRLSLITSPGTRKTKQKHHKANKSELELC